MLESSNPETFALNLVNIALGVFVLLGCLVFLRGLFEDLIDKALRRKSESTSIDQHSPLKSPSTLSIPTHQLMHDAAQLGDCTSWMRMSDVRGTKEKDRLRFTK